MSTSIPSSSSLPAVVPQHCLNVPVLYELLRGEEEHCRVWLRNEVNQIPDPLIDSLFHGLIMSSSSSAVPQSRLTVSELCGLLEGEKVEMKRVLRGELDRLTNTLFERLTNKLRTNEDWHRSEDGGDRAQVGNLLGQVESHNAQSHQVKREIKEENEMELKNVMDKATQTNEQIEDCVKQEFKEEEEDGETQISDIEGLAKDKQSGDDESRSVENAPMDTTPDQPIGQSQVNRQPGRVEKRKQTDEELQPQVQNEVNNRDSQEEVDEAEDDDGDGEEVTSRPVKRPRPSHPTISSGVLETQVITVTLRCPQNCVEMIAKHDFIKHMMEKHSIGPFSCAVKDCKQSFDNHIILSRHIKQVHQQTSQWHCEKCPKHYTTYNLLSVHNQQHHQLGHFRCSFPQCTFTRECIKKVYDHYRQQHKDIPEFVCGQSGCSYRTKNTTHFKAHERTHLGTKPFHCKWANCRYSSASRNVTMTHINQTHFKSRSKSRPDLTHLGQPKDYIEEVP